MALATNTEPAQLMPAQLVPAQLMPALMLSTIQESPTEEAAADEQMADVDSSNRDGLAENTLAENTLAENTLAADMEVIVPQDEPTDAAPMEVDTHAQLPAAATATVPGSPVGCCANAIKNDDVSTFDRCIIM